MSRRVTQRIFGNKVYFLFDWAATKREAVAEAKKLRKGGKPKSGNPSWFVRIVPAGDGYQIWRR